MQGKKIERVFISHRSEDKDVADMLISFLSRLGVSVEEFFCSSIPANGVEQYVSVEVKQAIRNSKINIVVLSKSYYESVYCLNEAGVLWYLDDIPVITITLPEITHDKIVGFLVKIVFLANSIEKKIFQESTHKLQMR
jgi:TIR domain.